MSGGQAGGERRCRGVDSESLEDWWLWGQILTPLVLAALAWRVAYAFGAPATAPAWMLPGFGPHASLAGLAVAAVLLWLFPVRFLRGALKLIRRRRSRAWRARHPDRWWLMDHRWSTTGATDGRARLRFAWFPFRVGETLAATLEMPVPVREYERLVLTLRCVQERWRKDHGLEGGLVAEDVHVQHQVHERASLPDSERVDLTFQLPEGDLGTYLSEHPPRYWELEVQAPRHGAALASTFLLPVYDRVPHPAQPAPGGHATADVDAAIADLIHRARQPGGVRGARAGAPGTVGGSIALGVEAGLFVVEQEANRQALSEAALAELLRKDRALLKSLLEAAGRRAHARPVFIPPVIGGPPRALPGSQRIDAIVADLERPHRWLVLSEVPMVHEEALLYRPVLGWRRLLTDRAREVGLESVVRRLEPLGRESRAAREEAALAVEELLARDPRAGTASLPPALYRQLESIEVLYESAVQRLESGTWWLADDRACGFVRGRGITVAHEGTAIRSVADEPMDELRERVLAAAVDGALTRFGVLAPELRAELEERLGAARSS